MSKENLSTVAMESLKESDRLFPRKLFFSTVLLMSHVLDIEPSSFDAGGIKIAVPDVSVIHGGLALVVYYYLWMYIGNAIQGNILLPLDRNRAMLQSLIRRAGKPYVVAEGWRKRSVRVRGVKARKRAVWRRMLIYNIFMAPFALAIVAIQLAALVIGFFDITSMAEFVFAKVTAD